MVKKAAGYLARNGPVSPQDRWEEDPGYTPFTVAAETAALLAAAELADLNHEASLANHLREIADVWNDSIGRWMYMSATDWCRKFQVGGYYVRIAPKTTGTDGASLQKNIRVKKVTASEDTRQASHLISPDALALVRFGLRRAEDPRICDTAKVIDALLKLETPTVPPGLVTTTTVTASMKMVRRLTERESVGAGRCSPASGRTTNWRRAARQSPKNFCPPWNHSPTKAV
jgi:glucoamylase